MNYYGILINILFHLAKIYWFVFRPKTYGVKCIVYCDDGVLMVRHSYGSRKWTFSGGGIKKGETPEQAVQREIMEEIGVAMENIEKIGQLKTDVEYKKDTVDVFAGKSANKEFKIDNKEIIEAKWFPFGGFPQMSKYENKILSMWGR